MALELQGKLLQLNPEQTGTGRNGNWVKQEMIIETTEQYPKKVCISAWGDKVEQIKSLQPGTDLKVSVNIESREYSGRWYTDVRAWRIDVIGAGANTATAAPQQQPDYSQPSQPASSQPVNDDLPF